MTDGAKLVCKIVLGIAILIAIFVSLSILDSIGVAYWIQLLIACLCGWYGVDVYKFLYKILMKGEV